MGGPDPYPLGRAVRDNIWEQRNIKADPDDLLLRMRIPAWSWIVPRVFADSNPGKSAPTRHSHPRRSIIINNRLEQ